MMTEQRPPPRCANEKCLFCKLFTKLPDWNLFTDIAFEFNADHSLLPFFQQQQIAQFKQLTPALKAGAGRTVYFIMKDSADHVTTKTLDDLAKFTNSSWKSIHCNENKKHF